MGCQRHEKIYTFTVMHISKWNADVEMVTQKFIPEPCYIHNGIKFLY